MWFKANFVNNWENWNALELLKSYALKWYEARQYKFNLGGLADGIQSNLVARMDENDQLDLNIWTQVGTLLSTRWAHRSIVTENKIIHIGGFGTK